MVFPIITILESLMLASALSIDTFVAGFAYGGNKIKIPFLSVQIINIVCSSILGISLFAGTLLRQYISSGLTVVICFSILFVLGIIKLLDSITKSIIRKHNKLNKEIKFSMLNFKFILNLYADPEKADVDCSRIISPMEALSLAVALSLDGLAVGFGAALGNVNGVTVFLCSLVTNAVGILLGCYIGNKIAREIRFDLSWLSGVLLIILAILKLF